MKIKEGFTIRTICGENVVVGEGLAQVNFNKILSLNESAAYLWKAVQGKEFTVDTLTDLLMEQYEVSREQASADAAKLIDVWVKEGVAC